MVTMAIYKKLIKSSSLNFNTVAVLVTAVVGWLQCQGVQGQEFMLNGVSYGNNETILLSEISDENFLVCTTTRTDCCGIDASGMINVLERGGEFYYPNGEAVPRRIDAGSDGLYRARGYQYIGLKRISSTSVIPPTGRYRCDIPDVNGDSNNLYINIDYDECTMGTNDCVDSATCGNTLESFVCVCPIGYSGNGRTSGTGCQDMNECELGTDECIGGTCVNTDGSYTCSCPSGFNGDGKMSGTGCQDINECTAAGVSVCQGVATCMNTHGSYQCDCPSGYRLIQNILCEDINECTDGTHSCQELAVCRNTLGSYQCDCPSGYRLGSDLTSCEDIDECAEGTDSCGNTCINTPGSFVCNCPSGYVLGDSGSSCTDVNECTSGTHSCQGIATCVNTPGSYQCNCPSGHQLTHNLSCEVAPPDIDFVISSEVDSSLYEKISNQEYAVKVGHQFQLFCNSTSRRNVNVTWFMLNSEGKFVTVVEVNHSMRQGTGGQSISNSTSTSTPSHMVSTHSNTIVHNEIAGQLYAYRISAVAVVLGTRDRRNFGADIGIGEVANGTYKCLAESEHLSSDLDLSIRVSVPTIEENSRHFLRFSTILFEKSAMESLNLASEEFVYAVFETALLKALIVLSTGRSDQEVVDCYHVTRRRVDEVNTWVRVECTMDNIPGRTSNELLSLIQESFVANLPDISREIVSQESITVSRHGFCDYDVFVSPDDRGEYEWNETSVSVSPIAVDCAFEPQDLSIGGMARRVCASHQKWTHPTNPQLSYDGIECATQSTYQLRKLSRLTTLNPDQVDEVGAVIVNIVADLNESGEQTADNLDIIANVYEMVDGLIQAGRLNVSEDFTNNTVNVLNGISTWPPDVVHMSSSTLVKSSERITTNLANQSEFTSLTVVEESIALQAERRKVMDLIQSGVVFSPPIQESLQNVSTNLSTQFPTEDNSTINVTRIDLSISIPPEAFKNSHRSDVGLVFSSYPTPILFPLSPPTSSMPADDYGYVVDSAVLGFTIPETEVNNLNDKVEITLQSLRAQAGMNWSTPICVSWSFNITKDGRGNWTDRGCKLVFMDLDTGEIKCECNHLTNFAVLVSVNPPANSEEVANALKVLSIIGAIISLIGLVITVFTMLFFRKIRKRDASKFHTQLCFAMIGLLLSYLIGIDRTENEIACTFFSCLIQYFTLASVFWMGAEAILMFKKLIIVFGRLSSKFIIFISLVCWGVPIVFPTIGLTTLGTGENFLVSLQGDDPDEPKAEYCFISEPRVQIGIFLLPLFTILLFNAIIFILVAGVLIRYTKRKIEKDKELQKNASRTTMKAMISIGSVMIMFGLSWLFGALTIEEGSIVFQWFFVILNTLQGFFLFLFFCIIGSDAREELKNFFTCNYFAKEQQKTSDSNTSRTAKHYAVFSSNNLTPGETNSSSLGRKVSASELNGDFKTHHRLNDKLNCKSDVMSEGNSQSSQDEEKEKEVVNEISTQPPQAAGSVPTETQNKVESESITLKKTEKTDSKGSQLRPQVIIYKVQTLESDVVYSWETTKTVSLQRACQNPNSYNHGLSDIQVSQV